MKIVFVSDALYPYNKGGKEKRLYELSTRLATMGYDVHIYTMHWWKSGRESRVENGVTLHALCKLHNMYQGERRSIKQAVLFGFACLKLAFVRFDIVDVDHMPFFPIFSSWLVTLPRHKKFFGTWHEALTRKEWVDYMGVGGNIASLIERACIRLPHHITASSPMTERLLKTVYGRGNQVSLVTPGIDVNVLASVKPLDKKIDVLYAGRLVKGKNVDKLIEAVALLTKQNPKFTCIIIGHGVEKERLNAQIKKLGLGKNITMMKPLPYAEDVYAYMKAAKVFCLPSTREGFGMVVLESLGCNTPVVTIDTPSNAARELVREGLDGSVVALNPEALAGAISYWIKHPASKDIASTVAGYDWSRLAKKQIMAHKS